MSTPPNAPHRSRGSWIMVSLALGLLAYAWSSSSGEQADEPRPAPVVSQPATTAPTAAPAPRQPAQPQDPSAAWPPAPPARALPVQAPTGATIGYTQDAQGHAKALRAGQLHDVPNRPGSFAVVDMWADGGPVVVEATPTRPVSEAELAKLRAAEKARDRAAGP